jgi:hypothetical protein
MPSYKLRQTCLHFLIASLYQGRGPVPLMHTWPPYKHVYTHSSYSNMCTFPQTIHHLTAICISTANISKNDAKLFTSITDLIDL